jgi:hypothetical protein
VTTHTILAAVTGSGTISPSGSVAVTDGADQTFTITPNSGYHVVNVIVDGASQGQLTAYKFSNVTGDHAISAGFLKSYQTDYNAILNAFKAKVVAVNGIKNVVIGPKTTSNEYPQAYVMPVATPTENLGTGYRRHKIEIQVSIEDVNQNVETAQANATDLSNQVYDNITADRKLGGLCVDVEPRFGPNFGYAKTPDNVLSVVVISDYVILLDRLEILT